VPTFRNNPHLHHPNIEVMKETGTFKTVVLILTEDIAVDLRNSLTWRKPTHPCSRLVTNVFQLNIHWAEVHETILYCLVVRAMRKFDFWFVTSGTPNK